MPTRMWSIASEKYPQRALPIKKRCHILLTIVVHRNPKHAEIMPEQILDTRSPQDPRKYPLHILVRYTKAAKIPESIGKQVRESAHRRYCFERGQRNWKS